MAIDGLYQKHIVITKGWSVCWSSAINNTLLGLGLLFGVHNDKHYRPAERYDFRSGGEPAEFSSWQICWINDNVQFVIFKKRYSKDGNDIRKWRLIHYLGIRR